MHLTFWKRRLLQAQLAHWFDLNWSFVYKHVRLCLPLITLHNCTRFTKKGLQSRSVTSLLIKKKDSSKEIIKVRKVTLLPKGKGKGYTAISASEGS